MRHFRNGGSNSGHRFSRGEENAQRKATFNKGGNRNDDSRFSGVPIWPINRDRLDILRQMQDLADRGEIRNPDPASPEFYVKLDPESPEGVAHMAFLREKLERLIVGHPEPGSPQ